MVNGRRQVEILERNQRKSNKSTEQHKSSFLFPPSLDTVKQVMRDKKKKKKPHIKVTHILKSN